MGNKDTSQIMGKGNVHLQMSLGYKLILKDARHVLELRLNLISAERLDWDGFCNIFGNRQLKLTKGAFVIERGSLCCTLYRLQAKTSEGEANAAEHNLLGLCHTCLGHVSENGLQTLARRKLLPSLKGNGLSSCIDCLFDKQHRVFFVKYVL